MATVLTLVRTPRRAESCSFSAADESPEVRAGVGDTLARCGLVSSGMRVTLGRGSRRSNAPADDSLPRCVSRLQTEPPGVPAVDIVTRFSFDLVRRLGQNASPQGKVSPLGQIGTLPSERGQQLHNPPANV